jgi:Reverse transcriptase (RNA-dependent DNA polymerase)
MDVRTLTAEQRSSIIRSSMFLKEKFLATGEFEKLKARLVAGGDQQNKNLYDDLSAPTVSTSAVFSVLAIAAHEGRHAAVVDIGGAFLNAEMKTGVDVHMRLDRTMSELMTRLRPDYERYLDSRGCVTVILDRALYGCVESAALWYENLSATMAALGDERNRYEICVFNKRDADGTQCTATVHVDDLLIVSTSKDMIDHLTEGLKNRYGEISSIRGLVLNYLGMTFDLSQPREARVSMKGYVDELLESSGMMGGARTPATDGLFEAREGAETAAESERVMFHSTVAKILYLAKKAQPDLLLAVSYLATRVSKCTKDDLAKLLRLVRYLRETTERGLLFGPGEKGITVSTYIDAAYGVHHDLKSHTGVAPLYLYIRTRMCACGSRPGVAPLYLYIRTRMCACGSRPVSKFRVL